VVASHSSAGAQHRNERETTWVGSKEALASSMAATPAKHSAWREGQHTFVGGSRGGATQATGICASLQGSASHGSKAGFTARGEGLVEQSRGG
jgi:hypothetical protein